MKLEKEGKEFKKKLENIQEDDEFFYLGDNKIHKDSPFGKRLMGNRR